MKPDSKSIYATMGTVVATVVIGGLGSFGAQAVQAWMEKYYVPRAEFETRLLNLGEKIIRLEKKR